MSEVVVTGSNGVGTDKKFYVLIDGRRLRGPHDRVPFRDILVGPRNARNRKPVAKGIFFIVTAQFNGKKYHQVGSTHTPLAVFDAKKRFIPHGCVSYQGVLMITNYGFLFE